MSKRNRIDRHSRIIERPFVGPGPGPGSGTVSAAAYSQVFSSYARATGLPSMLPANAALFWQSRCQYKDQGEIIALATNFSQRNLSVGVIVIDLGVPTDPPYFRLDPARFPDVPGMARVTSRTIPTQWGSIRFRLAPRTHAQRWPSVRVVPDRLTKSR